MDCPVCQNAQIEEGVSRCSECNSDLSAFALITEVENKRSGLRKTRTILLIILLLAVVGWAGTFATLSQPGAKEVEQGVVKDEADAKDEQISDLMAQVAVQKEKIEQLDGELVGLLATIESGVDESGNFTVHVVQEGESLWKISEKYHGDGLKHKHIADHNEIDHPHYIQVGDTIIIKH